MKFVLKTCAVAVMASFVGAPATAQNYSLEPYYGTVNLNTRFRPDPHVISARAGGPIDASVSATLDGHGCRGYISDAPDLRVNYTAGTTFPLIFSVSSSSDTTLVVHTPDGRWLCNDDGGAGENPSLRFDPAQSGQYDIWVGNYDSAALVDAELAISEVGSH